MQAEFTGLRPATIEDCDTIYKWQSIPGIRKFSRNPDSPTYEDHCQWMKRKLSQQDCQLYIVEDQSKPVGFLRLDIIEHERHAKEVSILIAPEYQNRGLASKALKFARDCSKGVDLLAYINPENTASIRLFSRSGYELWKNNYYRNCDS